MTSVSYTGGMNDLLSEAIEFACHSAACAPPKAGGTGGSLPGGGGTGGGAAPAAAGGPASNFRMKPGSRKTIKDTDGTPLGRIHRNSEGKYRYESSSGNAGGQANSVRDAVESLHRNKQSNHEHAGLGKKAADRTPAEKAAIKSSSDSMTSFLNKGEASRSHVTAQAKAHGPVKPADVVVSSDGTIKVKGQPITTATGRSSHKITKHVEGWGVDAAVAQGGSGGAMGGSSGIRYFKTKAAAKNAIAKKLNMLSTA